jgi:hypothetical protein
MRIGIGRPSPVERAACQMTHALSFALAVLVVLAILVLA